VRGYRHWFERTLGRKTFDFVYEEGGELVAIEIVLSGSPRWNAAQALKGLENEGICRLIIAGDTRKKLTEIGKALKNLDSFQAYGDRVEVCHLAEYVHG
jgi:cation transport ATPase